MPAGACRFQPRLKFIVRRKKNDRQGNITPLLNFIHQLDPSQAIFRECDIHQHNDIGGLLQGQPKIDSSVLNTLTS